MNLKSAVFYIIFMFMSFVCVSQTITLKGYVKDSIGNPLSYANVLIKPLDKTQNLKFAVTDDNGYYEVPLKKNETFTIKVTYLGYKPKEKQFTAKENTILNFTMVTSLEALEEVVIEMPVTVRGDTTSYKTDKFVKGNERKLKDVLKKLPGMEVSKNEVVTFKGKRVTDLMVDGKKFFGGNTKLGVENIPADAVEGIDVVENYNEVPFLKNLSESNKIAMNIKLKQNKKRFVFGDVELGKGNKNFYRTHANTFYYSPKTSLNFIGNTNNIAEKAFTFNDYQSFSNSVNAVFSKESRYRDNSLRMFLQNKDVIKASEQFAALNILKSTSSNFDVSGFLIFSKSKTNSFAEEENNYTAFLENKTTNNDVDATLGIGKLYIEYEPSYKSKWYARTQAKFADGTANNTIKSKVNAVENNIITNKENENIDLVQNIEWHTQFSRKHTLSFLLDFKYLNNSPNTKWNFNLPILSNLIPFVPNQNQYRFNQFLNDKRNRLRTELKHFWVFSTTNHLYTTLKNDFRSEDFFTNDFQILDNTNINNFNANDFGNNTNLIFNNLSLAFHYKIRTGKFTINPGISFSNFNWKVNQQNRVNNTKWVVLPEFWTKIELKKAQEITIDYAVKSEFSDVSKLANRYYLQSYNAIFRGNELLENQLYHNARISYSKFSLYRGLILLFNINYRKYFSDFRNTVVINGLNRFIIPQMIQNPSEDVLVFFNLNKKIKKIRANIAGNFHNANFIQILNTNQTINDRKNYSYEIGFETLFDNFPTIEVSLENTIGKFRSANTTSKFTTLRPSIDIDYEFLKGFTFNFDYERTLFKNKTLEQKSDYEIGNVSLFYKKETSAWSYKIEAKNIFNTTFKRQSSFSEYVISDQKTFVFPRTIVFSLGYNL